MSASQRGTTHLVCSSHPSSHAGRAGTPPLCTLTEGAQARAGQQGVGLIVCMPRTETQLERPGVEENRLLFCSLSVESVVGQHGAQRCCLSAPPCEMDAPPSEMLVDICRDPAAGQILGLSTHFWDQVEGSSCRVMRRPLDLAPADEGLYPEFSPAEHTLPSLGNPSVLPPSVPSCLPPTSLSHFILHSPFLPPFLALILISGFLFLICTRKI